MINFEVIAVLLMIYIAGHDLYQSIAHRKERKDLYDRLMSKDLCDYKAGTGERVKKPTVSAHQKAMDVWRNMGGDEQ